MNYKKLVFLLLFSSYLSVGQVQVSEHIKSSEIVTDTNSSLYFIDFWATWCIPCVNASKYLTVLQEQYPKDLHIVSLSQENSATVKKFLKKHDIKLTVALDYEGRIFNKYNVHSLPYGVLLNANGAKIWEGYPSELKSNDVKRFLNQYLCRTDFHDFFTFKKTSTTIETKYSPKADFEFDELSTEENDGFLINNYYNRDFIELKGNLRDVLAYGWKVNPKQIKISEGDNIYYRFYFRRNSKAAKSVSRTIINALNLSSRINNVPGEVYVLDMKSSNLWDTFQIDWKENPQSFLISETNIKADNVSVKGMAYILGKVLDRPIVVTNNANKETLHDWDIHYKYFDLMVSGLLDFYGIKLGKSTEKYPNYLITKKAP